MPRTRRESGAVSVEYALMYAGVIVPLTFGVLYAAQMLWIWHSVGEWTRDAARYASTHCWQSSADNVTGYMRNNVPPMVDAEQFRGGSVELAVTYYGRDVETGTLTPFNCDAECSTLCIPETVTVAVRNYEYRTFLTYLGLAPIPIPDFQTTVHMESAGCDPEQGICNP
jgi:hypothetical protein